MKYWRRNANKVAVTTEQGGIVLLKGRELRRYMQVLQSRTKPMSLLLERLIKRI